MIFENLLINNFGVYCGKQNFDLTTQSKKPVILIVQGALFPVAISLVKLQISGKTTTKIKFNFWFDFIWAPST